jgi:tripartite-type tricarboxylate transporter receptor subunit TctC
MKRRHLLAASGALLQLPSLGWAQARYPERAIRLVVPFAPGGDGDVMGRAWVKYAVPLSNGYTIFVDNKAGAGGVIGAAEVARAKPDGYTLLLGTTTTQIINPLASPNPTYDPIKDFVLIGMVSANPTCIVVNPSLPVNSLAELTAYAKANPLSYGSAGQGTITNLTGELYKYLAGKLNIQHVPYKGGGPAMQDLVAGHVPIITPIMSSAVLTQHRAGKARILAVNSPTRLKAAPDIPTAVESGLPDMRVQVFNAVFAPAGTPKPVIDTLRALAQRTQADSGFVQEVEKSGAEVLNVTDPEKFIQDEVSRWGQAIKMTQFKIG